MNAAKLGLLGALVGLNVAFVIAWVRHARRRSERTAPTAVDIAIGFVTDFLDALGIGSFAPTTALFKFRRVPADDLIPGTLNVGHNAAAFVETVFFVTAVAVDPILLVSMIGSATVGAWLGAGVVSRLPRRAIRTIAPQTRRRHSSPRFSRSTSRSASLPEYQWSSNLEPIGQPSR